MMPEATNDERRGLGSLLRSAAGILYPILDLRERNASELLARADALLAAGSRIVQLRSKKDPVSSFLDLANALLERTRRAGALLIVNDRLDVALSCGADGVHLGQDDLPPLQARSIAPRQFLVGLSTHSVEQARAADPGLVDYIGFGPMYPTMSKTNALAPRGTDVLAAARTATSLPIVAIGGINEKNAPEVLAAGADSVAMIGTLESCTDSESLLRRLETLRPPGSA